MPNKLNRVSDKLRSLPGTEKDELEARYRRGLWVFHKQFGAGLIIKKHPSRRLRVYIQFNDDVRLLYLDSDALSPLILEDDLEYLDIKYRKDPEKDELAVVGVSNQSIERIVIPQFLRIKEQDYAVTAIGDLAFANLKRLTDITIPETIKTISYNAFYGSDNLRQIKNEACGHESATIIMNESGRWGILANPARKVDAIPCQFEDIRFYAGFMVEKQRIPTFYFLVRQNDLWGIISKTGHQLVPCIYDALSPKEDGQLCIGFEYRKGGRTGLINAKGEEVINP